MLITFHGYPGDLCAASARRTRQTVTNAGNNLHSGAVKI